MILRNFEHHLKIRKGAIHIGANVGEERYWYVKQGFNPVLWFEPNKDIFPILKENIGILSGHYAFNYGIHDEIMGAKLNIANNAGQSSSILEFGTHALNHPDVKYIGEQDIFLRRIDAFFKMYEGFKDLSIENYNFLNVDVQGVELNVIKSFGTLIAKMDYVYAEVNEEEVYKGCACVCDIDEYLHIYGFKRVETLITKAKWGDALYVRN